MLKYAGWKPTIRRKGKWYFAALKHENGTLHYVSHIPQPNKYHAEREANGKIQWWIETNGGTID